MASSSLSVTVTGLPSALSSLKLQLLVEKKVGKGLLADAERRPDGSVLFTFNDEEGFWRFKFANLTEVSFGNETHQLTIVEKRTETQITTPPNSHRRESTDERGDDDSWRRKLHVTNIPPYLYSYVAFRGHFEKFGRVEKCYMKDTKRFAYVTFASHLDAVAARHGAVPAGWQHKLTIAWANREELPSNFPPPYVRQESAYNRPASRGFGNLGPRRWSSTTELRPGTQRETRMGRQQHKSEATLDLSLIKKEHYWSNLRDIPMERGTICVLVQHIDTATNIENIRMHFESKKRSNGGPVKNIIRLIDGLLIMFKHDQDCRSCLEMVHPEFDGKSISVYGKLIPTYFERKFVIQGIGQKTTSDTVAMFMESCSKNEISPTCSKQMIPGVYLVEYGDDFDHQEAENILTNIHIKQLEGRALKASKLLRTDCLKITGVDANVSSDTIKLVFESKKRTDGGPVTRLDRLQNKMALVYFAAFTDAERVYERFKKPCNESIVIGQSQVEVSLYFHALANDHKNVTKEALPVRGASGGDCQAAREQDNDTSNPSRPLRSFDYQASCKVNILRFLNDNKGHFDQLKKTFADFAIVKIDLEKKNNRTPFVTFFPEKRYAAESQKKFNADCRKKFETFVANYTTASKTFDSGKLKNARARKSSTLLDAEYKGDLMGDVTVSWKNNTVEITGLKEKVNKHLQELASSMLDAISKQMAVNRDQFITMVCCGIVEELEEKHQTLMVNCDEKSQTITLSGTADEIQTAQISALTMLNTVERKKLTGLHETVLQYLAETAKDSTNLKTMISKQFRSDGVKAAITFDGEEVCARVRSDASFNRATEAIKKLFGVEKYEVDEGESTVISTPQWKGFIQRLKETGLPRVYIKENEGREAIIIVGPKEDLSLIQTKISTFLDENATRLQFYRLPYGSAKFVVEKSKGFLDSCKSNGVRCSLTAKNGGGVSLEGKRQVLNKACSELNQIIRNMSEVSQTLTEPGSKQYYEGEEGKGFLKTAELVHNCIILASSKTCPEWEREAHRNAVTLQRWPVASAQTSQDQLVCFINLPNSRASLQVWKTNIVEHNCDVIINASNTDLKLLSGGVSGEIRKLDGPNGVIQKQMIELVRKNFGDFLAGDAVITAAGNLPACKKIVHAIGPRWNSSTEQDPANKLKSCVFKSLQETARAGMKSISIPAISCGVFGGRPDVCLPLIVEAVVDYFKEETTSCITRVDFVENQKNDILQGFKSCILKYGSSRKTMTPPSPAPRSTSALRPTPAPRPQFSTRANLFQAFQNSPTTSLHQGDLAKTHVDVLVNITSPQGFPNMQGSRISKTLLHCGGATIQVQCSQTPGPYTPGSVYRTSGGSLSCREIFHGIVTNYSSNSKNIVRGIVAQCLRMADNAGYSSVAFPAIATGGFNHPAADVARWMHAEISNFSAVNLSNVLIVLHPSGPAIIPVFQAEFSSTPRSSASTSNNATRNSNSSTVNFGGINVNVYRGDITQETTDAIVNSTNAHFDLSQGMVSQAILTQGGQGIQTEIWRTKGVDCRRTSSGSLSCGAIFHIVAPSEHNDLLKKLSAVLRDADQQGMRTISFPALSTGGVGLSSTSVAQAMRKAFEKFGKSGFSSLKTINVVLFDETMLKDFKKGILGSSQTILGRVRATFNAFLGGNSSLKKSPIEESFDLFLYSTDAEAINKALEHITTETKKKVLSKVIQDGAFGRLSLWEMSEIKEVATGHKVKITDITNKYIEQYKVEGLVFDVIKVHDAIKDILKEFCAAETTASFVIWENYVNGNWEKYHPRSAHILEKAYKARNGNNTDLSLNNIKVPMYRYHNFTVYQSDVDLSNLEGDPHGNNPPTVRRRVKEKATDDVLPKTWDPMHGQPFLKVSLKSNSSEYQTALNAFSSTGGGRNIVKIERIQNESLYKQYIAKKSEVKAKMTTGMPLERRLFHGTSDDDKIVLHGFDRSYAGKNATVHGRGVYFATFASYSNSFAAPDGNGHKRMFIADVITGDYCQGDPSYVAPPPRRSGIKNDLHDSVVNNVRNPTIFVIFKDASAYPTYLVTYA